MTNNCKNGCKCEKCTKFKAQLNTISVNNDKDSLAFSLASIVLDKVNNAKTIKHNKDSVSINID